MRAREYGTEHSQVVILLHGGGLGPWNYREEAERLKAYYHVVLPILDGHAGSDRSFSTIEENARALIEEIDERFGGQVLLIGGLSLGGQVLVEMLSQQGYLQIRIDRKRFGPAQADYCRAAPAGLFPVLSPGEAALVCKAAKRQPAYQRLLF